MVDRDENWINYLQKVDPSATMLSQKSEVFDLFNHATGEAVSGRVLNTLSVNYMENPQRIFWSIKDHIDEAAYNTPVVESDMDPAKIRSRTIHLAIRGLTSPAQWPYLFSAILHGKVSGVRLVITRIKD